MPNRDVLNFITSGRMSSLRELSIAVEYKDWVRLSLQFCTFLFDDICSDKWGSIISYNGSLKSLICDLSTFHS
jgi:hypothetical protein